MQKRVRANTNEEGFFNFNKKLKVSSDLITPTRTIPEPRTPSRTEPRTPGRKDLTEPRTPGGSFNPNLFK